MKSNAINCLTNYARVLKEVIEASCIKVRTAQTPSKGDNKEALSLWCRSVRRTRIISPDNFAFCWCMLGLTQYTGGYVEQSKINAEILRLLTESANTVRDQALTVSSVSDAVQRLTNVVGAQQLIMTEVLALLSRRNPVALAELQVRFEVLAQQAAPELQVLYQIALGMLNLAV